MLLRRLAGVAALTLGASAQYTCIQNTVMANLFTGGTTVICQATNQATFDACIAPLGDNLTPPTIIKISPGTYTISQFFVATNTCIEGTSGDPASTVLLPPSTPSSSYHFFAVPGARFQIIGATLDGGSDGGGLDLLTSTNMATYNTVFTRCVRPQFNQGVVQMSGQTPQTYFAGSGTVFRSNTAGGVIKQMSNSIVDIGPNVLFDSNILVPGVNNVASGVFLGIGSTITWACDTRFINMTTPWVRSSGDNICANNATTPLNCFNASGCTYNYNQPNGNFSCPCALSQAVELTATFKNRKAVLAGRKAVLAVAVTSATPSLPTGTPALIVTLPAGGAVVYKMARASPLLKPKTKPTQTGSVLTWTPAPVPVGQKTAKRNTRTYRYTMRVSKTAAAGTYNFPVAFQILDANGLILEQIFAEATLTVKHKA